MRSVEEMLQSTEDAIQRKRKNVLASTVTPQPEPTIQPTVQPIVKSERQEAAYSRPYIFQPNDFTPDYGKILESKKEVEREYDAYRRENVGQPMEYTPEDKAKMEMAMTLRNEPDGDYKLTEKNVNDLLRAAPYLSEPLKKRLEDSGGYKKAYENLRNGSTNGIMPPMLASEDEADLRSAIMHADTVGSAIGGAGESLSFGLSRRMAEKRKAPDRLLATPKEIGLKEHPFAYRAGYMGGEVVKYAAASKVAATIPALQVISNPFVRGVVTDMAVDTSMNAINAASDIAGGASPTEAGKTFLKNEAIDTGLNLVSGSIIDRKGLKALFQGQDAGKAAREAAENTAEVAVKSGKQSKKAQAAEEAARKDAVKKQMEESGILPKPLEKSNDEVSYGLTNDMTEAELDEYFKEDNLFHTFLTMSKEIHSKNYGKTFENMLNAVKNGVYNWTDFTRNMQETFIRKGTPEMREFGQNVIAQLDLHKKKYANYVKEMMDEYDAVIIKGLGINPGKKADKALFRYLDGNRIVGKKPDGTVNTVPYTFDDLVEDVGQDLAHRIETIAVPWYRQKMDDAYNRINAAYSKIYPDVQKKFNEELSSVKGMLEKKMMTLETLQAELKNADDSLGELGQQLAKKKGGTKVYDALLKKREVAMNRKQYVQEQIEKVNEIIEANHRHISKLESDWAEGTYWRQKELPYRKGYITHVGEKPGSLAYFWELLDSNSGISPDLILKSAHTKPKSGFRGFMEKQGKGAYNESAAAAFSAYIPKASLAMHIDPMIKLFRDISDNLSNVKKMGGGASDANELILFFDNFANDLAGKTSKIGLDQKLREVEDRNILKLIDDGVNRIKRSKVLYNFATILKQSLNYNNTIATLKNPKHLFGGIGDTIIGIFGNKEIKKLYEQSGFLKERYLGDSLYKLDYGLSSKAGYVGGKLMEIPEKATVLASWNGFYRQAVANNIPNPIHYADIMARKMHGGRGIGEVPLALKSRTYNIAAPFMLEVQNSFNVVLDLFKRADAIGKKQKIKVDIPGLLMLFTLNAIAEDVQVYTTGSGGVLNPIGSAVKGYRNTEGNALQKTIGAFQGVAANLASNIPITSVVGQLVPENTRTAIFGRENPIQTRYGVANLIGQALSKPFEVANEYAKNGKTKQGLKEFALETISNLVPGGSQFEKTVKGIQAVNEGGVYNPAGELKYPVKQNTGSYIKGALFGPSSFRTANAYYDQRGKPMSEGRTAVYDALKNGDNNVALYNALAGRDLPGGKSEDQMAQQLQGVFNWLEENDKSITFLPSYLEESSSVKIKTRSGIKKVTKDVELSPTQKEWYNQHIGEAVAKALQEVMQKDYFMSGDFSQKNEYLKKAKQNAMQETALQALER